MTAKERLDEERDGLKNARMTRILESAFLLFSESGIDNIAMTDIAKKAEIGVASLYRYYETKDEIAIRTAIWAWEMQKENIMPQISDSTFEALTGLNQIKKIFSLFSDLLETQRDFLRFIYFFDSYAVRTQIASNRLKDYEKTIGTVQSKVKDAIVKGIEDDSIKSEYKGKEDSLYFTLMHTLFSTSQKLCLSGNMLDMDKASSGKSELETLSKILIEGIKK